LLSRKHLVARNLGQETAGLEDSNSGWLFEIHTHARVFIQRRGLPCESAYNDFVRIFGEDLVVVGVLPWACGDGKDEARVIIGVIGEIPIVEFPAYVLIGRVAVV